MDKLEKFIRSNRQSFDEARLPEAGWNQLESKLNGRGSKALLFWRVAAVLFLLSTLVLAGLLLQRENQPAKMTPLAQHDDREMTIEEFYIQQISLKKDEYEKLAGENPSLVNELAAFDAAYDELSQSFETVKNDELVNAMLENLRLRIVLLNEQIELLKTGKGDEETYWHTS